MFIWSNALKNLFRYRRRYLITLSGLIGILGFCFYGMVYYPLIRDYNAVTEERFMSRIEFRFRDELQYLQDRGKDETAVNYVDEKENFNADGSMDGYDYDLTVSREYFEQFSDSPHISGMDLAYGCRVYAQMKGGHDFELSRKGLLLYGGEPDTLNLYLNEIMYRDFPRELQVAEGRKAEPGAGECMLYRDMAEFNGLEIGDMISLQNESGDELIELKIVGLVVCNIDYGTHLAEEDLNFLGYRIGSMPYRRLKTTLLYHVFTDFDTAYEVYGSENDPEFARNHTFNNYIPMFRLTSSDAYSDFTAELPDYSYDSNLHFYPLSRACEPYLREYDERAALLTVMIAGILSLVTITVMMMLLLKERHRETECLYALGIERKKIYCGWMIETAVFITVLSALAMILAASADRIFDLIGKSYFDPLFRFQISTESAGMIGLSSVLLTGIVWLESRAGLISSGR